MPRNSEGQPVADRPSAQGQETAPGPENQGARPDSDIPGGESPEGQITRESQEGQPRDARPITKQRPYPNYQGTTPVPTGPADSGPPAKRRNF